MIHDSDGAENGAKVRVEGALEFGIVGEGDGERAGPRVCREVKLFNGGWVGKRNVGSAVCDAWRRRWNQLCREG